MNKKKKRKIIFTGGGTGGHIFPLVAIIRQLKDKESLELAYIGPKDKWSDYIKNEGIKTHYILGGKIRRTGDIKDWFLNIIEVIKLGLSFLKSFWVIFWSFPDALFSKGGTGSVPVTLAGKLLLVPIFVHESDSVMGLSNKIAQKWALEVFVSFPNTEGVIESKKIVVGNPIREELTPIPPNIAKDNWHIPEKEKVVLILGGSQGSQRLNDTILLILQELVKDYILIHQVGERNIDEIKKESVLLLTPDLDKRYLPIGFMGPKQLSEALSMADLVVARAGASTIFELALFGKPSILIPLPESAQNHQVKNAYEYARFGACQVIEEKNLTPNFLLERINEIIQNPYLKEKMTEGALSFARPKAAHLIAEYLLEYISQV